MKILLYGINFAPELTGIGKYTGEMAAWLARLAMTGTGIVIASEARQSRASGNQSKETNPSSGKIIP
ncbi:MAG: hypothetical protein ACD_23C01156G0001 [uncultured bacterium]|nr:MAG: hypothetical protein ACD_23C01156G0001 [uncultured bacterium]